MQQLHECNNIFGAFEQHTLQLPLRTKQILSLFLSKSTNELEPPCFLGQRALMNWMEKTNDRTDQSQPSHFITQSSKWLRLRLDIRSLKRRETWNHTIAHRKLLNLKMDRGAYHYCQLMGVLNLWHRGVPRTKSIPRLFCMQEGKKYYATHRK